MCENGWVKRAKFLLGQMKHNGIHKHDYRNAASGLLDALNKTSNRDAFNDVLADFDKEGMTIEAEHARLVIEALDEVMNADSKMAKWPRIAPKR